VSDDEHAARLLTTAASQLAAYLATPGLPSRVELLCLAAAAKLPRAAAAPASSPPQLGPDQVLHTLSQLSEQLRATALMLDAVADLNAAADALRVP
jgi:hypothetical protein